MKRPRAPAFGLRAKLALVALCLLAMPWVGYRYVQEMERLLLEGKEQTLIATARAVATALHDRPVLMRVAPRDDSAARRQADEELQQLARSRLQTEPQQAGQNVSDAAEPEAAGARDQTVAPLHQGPADGELDEIAAILQGLERNAARIWVVNRERRVLSLTGSLKQAPPAAEPYPDGIEGWLQRLVRPLLSRLIRAPRAEFDEPASVTAMERSNEVDNALRGLPGARVRASADGQAVIISAAHPIWSRDEVLGAVVVEETSHPILSLRNRALERLLVLTLVVFVVGAAVLLAYATRLSHRIRTLRDEAENAVDAQGRISRIVSGSRARDEIGDLSRSFSSALEKLSQYHAYLESMASRLSHELRTPITVVRSSLENLKLQPLPEETRIYVSRAEEGVDRLSRILTRMSEASRLEQSLRSAERERYDLSAVVSGCVEGYRLAYPDRCIQWQAPIHSVMVSGSPDLAAQLLDKLVSNAADFAKPGTPISIDLALASGEAMLSVANEGPTLSEQIRAKLFTSLVSFRNQRPSDEPHLGLGLYIARLIAEFHGGSVGVTNLPDREGVRVWVSYPLS